MQKSEQRQYSSIFEQSGCYLLSTMWNTGADSLIFKVHSRLHLKKKCNCWNHFVARFSGPHKSGEVFSPCPPLPHFTILWTSSSMACIIRHRRRRGAPQKEAGAHTKTFAFLHLIRVVITQQRKRPAPRYLASFYRWRLKRTSKCQLLAGGKKGADLPGATSLFYPLHTSLPPAHPLPCACLTGAL